MKVIFFCSYYDQYLTEFYKKNPSLAESSYGEQLQALKDDHFGHWDAYVEEFIKRGSEAQLIIPNCKPLQLAWARENNFRPEDKNWNFQIAIEQAKSYKPDVFYISSMFEYYNGFLTEIKKYSKHIFSWINCPLPANVDLSNVELILTSVPYFVDNFRAQEIPSELMHSAFDASILESVGSNVKQDIELSFIGSLTRFHAQRIKIIKQLLDHTPLQVFGTGIELIPDERGKLKRFLNGSRYKERAKGQVWGVEMYRTLRRSRITFNAHIDMSKNYIGNMRMYEATGMGTLLLTDGKHAPWKNFNDDEVAYYDSIEEAVEKAKYFLANENERKQVAAKGHARTLREYNYSLASDVLIAHFETYMKN